MVHRTRKFIAVVTNVPIGFYHGQDQAKFNHEDLPLEDTF